jgi:hypothetical protein
MNRYIRRLVGLWAVLAVFLAAAPVDAQDDSICFPNVPGIGSCISGRFYEYWRQNGGLPVFGYPLTSEFEQVTPEGTFTVQYFERQRFEYHPEIARPYDVLLGRLGDEILRRQGRDWRTDPVPPTIPGDVCRRYDVTRHIVCGDFLLYWFENGLRLDNDPALRYDESLALWGLPLMEPRVERNADGFNVDTQWFERARFEFYPDNPDPYKVLIGRLGSEALVGVQSFFGGESAGHNAGARQIRIESQRDGSVLLVQYTAQTQIVCFGGEAVPANLLDRPMLKLSAEGVYDARGVLHATKITALC